VDGERVITASVADVPGSDIVIRHATSADAGALSAFAERIFRETFGPDNTPANLDLYCLQAFSPALQAAEIADTRTITLIAERRRAIVGFAQLRLGPVPPCVTGPMPMELVRFYVDTPLHGTGLARRLMEAVVDEARVRAMRTLWLGVWEHNPRAQAFYRKAGFVDVGAQTFRLGSDVQTDRVMSRSLDVS
jgi:ribosomal protein S18 acetylase RimI-like enzyme